MLPDPAFRTSPPLEGRFIRLESLTLEHAEPLALAGRSSEVWTYLRYGPLTTPEQMAAHIRSLLERKEAGTDLPFAVVRRDTGVPIGMTRFLAIEREDSNVEIGGTWLDRDLWRSPFNTDSKRLMFGHAFDTEGAERVQIKTDVRNLRSQRAIERLGAVREGVLRAHVVMPDGYRRSSVYYSVLPAEWPEVRARLDRLLERPWTPSGASPMNRDRP
jgi:RimJ/RimL family protein N-acetyltransferase